MKSLWEKLNDATQPGANVTKDQIADIAETIGYVGREPLIYILKRAQRLAQMKGKAIKSEADYLFFIGQAIGNKAAQFGVMK